MSSDITHAGVPADTLAVAPNWRREVRDTLILTLPIAGGKATRITDGLPFDVQPRWSPDGKQIVYVTDRDGSDDVWIMDADGKNARQISRTDRTQFLSPDFTPDGKYIIVSRNAVQYGTQYNLYMYHKDGGTGVRVTGAAAAGGGAAPAPGPGGPGYSFYVIRAANRPLPPDIFSLSNSPSVVPTGVAPDSWL